MTHLDDHTLIFEQNRLAQARTVHLRERSRLLVHASQQRLDQSRSTLAASRPPQP